MLKVSVKAFNSIVIQSSLHINWQINQSNNFLKAQIQTYISIKVLFE